MPKTSEYDRPLAYNEDGQPDLWDSDTREGQARIVKRQAQAEAERHAAGRREITISDGLWWTDRKTGERKWSNGTQVFEMIHKEIREGLAKQQTKNQEGLETIVTALGVKFREQRDGTRRQLAADFSALESEVRAERDLTKKRADDALLTFREDLLELRQYRDELKAEIDELRSLKQPRLVKS